MYLSHGGMNADCIVQVFLGDTLQDGHRESLSDLSSVRAKEVDADDTVMIGLVDDYLGVAVECAFVIEVPLQGLVYTTVCYDISVSELFASILFTVAHTSVFDGGKDSGGDVAIAHQPSSLVEKTRR